MNKRLNAWIDPRGEYRYNVKSSNGKIIQGSTEGFSSRFNLEHNLKLNHIDPNQLPQRITKKDKK